MAGWRASKSRWRRLQFDDSSLHADHRGVRSVVCAQFREDGLDSALDGFLRDRELIRDLLVRITSGDQASDIVAGEMLTGRRPGDCANAIEAKQAVFGCEPEVTVGCLSNLVDGASGKALTDFPQRVRVLAGIERRIERERGL